MKPFYEDRESPYEHTVLVFPKEWVGTKLPANWHPDRGSQDQLFEITLADVEDGGKEYKATAWPSYYANGPCHEDWVGYPGMGTVSVYSYLQHYCACHRKTDAAEAGADTDDECEGDRFKVKSITAPAHLPGVVLYSETLKAADLTPPEAD